MAQILKHLRGKIVAGLVTVAPLLACRHRVAAAVAGGGGGVGDRAHTVFAIVVSCCLR